MHDSLEDGEVLACPECDSSSVKINSRNSINSADGEKYRCAGCGAQFDDPVKREARGSQNGRRGLAGRLNDADPEDVGRPMTDGGRDPMERIAGGIEEIAAELRYQNAVLTELAMAQHQTAVAGNEHVDPDEKPTSSPTTRSMLTKVRDHEHERERTDRHPLLPDGGEDGQQENLLIVEEEEVGERNGYPVKEGVRYRKEPISGKWFKVTRWEDRGGDSLRSITKQEADESEIEEAIGR